MPEERNVRPCQELALPQPPKFGFRSQEDEQTSCTTSRLTLVLSMRERARLVWMRFIRLRVKICQLLRNTTFRGHIYTKQTRPSPRVYREWVWRRQTTHRRCRRASCPDDAAVFQSTPIPLASPGPGNTLPAFVPMANSHFRWGELDASAFTSLLDSAYKEVVHWRRNCFSIPKGHVSKVFVNELARLFSAFASGSALALKATIVLPHLVLQKPHRRSKPKDHASLLERRMKLWEQTELLKEGRAIQNRFPSSRHQGNEQQVARSFAKMMFQGKTQAALQLLTDQGKGGLLHLNNPVTPLSTVKDVLWSKHPPCNPASLLIPSSLEFLKKFIQFY